MPRPRRLLILTAIGLFVIACGLSYNAFGSHATPMHITGLIAAGWALFALAFVVD